MMAFACGNFFLLMAFVMVAVFKTLVMVTFIIAWFLPVTIPAVITTGKHRAHHHNHQTH